MNIDELRDALREGPTPPPLDGHAIIARVQRARRRAVGVVSGLLAALLVGTLWLVWEISEPRPATPRPQVQGAPITPPTPTIVRTPTPSPTPSRTPTPTPTPVPSDSTSLSSETSGVATPFGDPSLQFARSASLCLVNPPQRLLDVLSKPNQPVVGEGTGLIDAGIWALDPVTGATLEVQNSMLYYVSTRGSGLLAFPLPPNAQLVSPQISGGRVLFGIETMSAKSSLTDWYTWTEGAPDVKRLAQLDNSRTGVIVGDDVVVATQGPDDVGDTLLRIPFAGGIPQALATWTEIMSLQTWGTDSVIFISRKNPGDSLTQRLTVINVTTGTQTALPQTMAAFSVGAFATDGQRIAFVPPADQPGLYYWEPGITLPRMLIGEEAGAVGHVAIQGNVVVYRPVSSSEIGIVDLASGSWTMVPETTTGRAFSVTRFVLSANSLYLATEPAPGRRDVLISPLPSLGGC